MKTENRAYLVAFDLSPPAGLAAMTDAPPRYATPLGAMAAGRPGGLSVRGPGLAPGVGVLVHLHDQSVIASRQLTKMKL